MHQEVAQSVLVSHKPLSEALKLVSGVIENSQVMPILAFVHVHIDGQILTVTATNSEVEVSSTVELVQAVAAPLALTLPCRKLMDILRSTQCEAVQLDIEAYQVRISMGNVHYTLKALPAEKFPFFKSFDTQTSLEISEAELSSLLRRSAFAMALQDARYFLNGMLWDFASGEFKTVATDGHRLAMNAMELPNAAATDAFAIIVPRKTVLALLRMLGQSDQLMQIFVGKESIAIQHEAFSLRTHLIEANYPPFQKLLPRRSEFEAIIPVASFQQALQRVSVLANEKFRGVRFNFSDKQLQLYANNLDREEAQEVIAIVDGPEAQEVAFNIDYLIDVLHVMESDNVVCRFSGQETGMVMQEEEASINSVFVIMPLTI